MRLCLNHRRQSGDDKRSASQAAPGCRDCTGSLPALRFRFLVKLGKGECSRGRLNMHNKVELLASYWTISCGVPTACAERANSMCRASSRRFRRRDTMDPGESRCSRRSCGNGRLNGSQLKLSAQPWPNLAALEDLRWSRPWCGRSNACWAYLKTQFVPEGRHGVAEGLSRLVYGMAAERPGEQTISESQSWWPGTELNRRRQPFQGCALPPELPGHFRGTLPQAGPCGEIDARCCAALRPCSAARTQLASREK